MAKIHIMQRAGAEWQVLYHVPIPGTGPNSANAVGVLWRDALVRSGKAQPSRLIVGTPALPTPGGTITEAENTALLNGSVLEIVRSIDPTQGDPNRTVAQMVAVLNTDYDANVQALADEIKRSLSHFGAVITDTI